jgi:hypothetical protein
MERPVHHCPCPPCRRSCWSPANRVPTNSCGDIGNGTVPIAGPLSGQCMASLFATVSSCVRRYGERGSLVNTVEIPGKRRGRRLRVPSTLGDTAVTGPQGVADK